MKIELARTGATVAGRHLDLLSWRQWAYDEATDRQTATVGPVALEVRATSRDRRALPSTLACLKAVELVVDGLSAGGMIATQSKVVELRVLSPIVTGEDGMLVTISDALAPF